MIHHENDDEPPVRICFSERELMMRRWRGQHGLPVRYYTGSPLTPKERDTLPHLASLADRRFGSPEG